MTSLRHYLIERQIKNLRKKQFRLRLIALTRSLIEYKKAIQLDKKISQLEKLIEVPELEKMYQMETKAEVKK